jgi:hypothetical protein
VQPEDGGGAGDGLGDGGEAEGGQVGDARHGRAVQLAEVPGGWWPEERWVRESCQCR